MTESVVLGVGADEQPLSLTPQERSTHMHVLGATGQGKSKFLEQLIRQDIRHRHGVCLIDPHGTLYHEIIAWCARHHLHRKRRIHLIDPNSAEWTVGFNPLHCSSPEYLSKTIDGAVEACAQVWGGEDSSRTPLLKKCLRAVFFALAARGHTLGEAMALTTVNDIDGFRAEVTSDLDDEIYQAVWDDLNSLSKREFMETFSSTNNRLMEFLANPTIRRMLRLKDRSIDLRQCMEQGDILLVNLQTDKISGDSARLIGTLLTNSLFNTAVQRSERSAKARPFYLYIDECYRFMTSDVEGMLDQTRKFGLHVILAHQHLSQLSKYGEHVYNAVMSNARTKVVFGVGSEQDAEVLAKELLRETFDYNRPKEILSKPTVVGYERIILNSRMVARGKGVTNGTSSMEADIASSAAGSGMMQSFGADGLPVMSGYTDSVSAVTSSGSTRAQGKMSAVSESIVEAVGEGEALQPILEIMPTAVEGQEEILNRAILALRKLPKRAFFLARPKEQVTLLITPKVEEPPVNAKRIAAFSERAREASPFMAPLAEANALIAARKTRVQVMDDDDDDAFCVPDP